MMRVRAAQPCGFKPPRVASVRRGRILPVAGRGAPAPSECEGLCGSRDTAARSTADSSLRTSDPFLGTDRVTILVTENGRRHEKVAEAEKRAAGAEAEKKYALISNIAPVLGFMAFLAVLLLKRFLCAG